MSTLSESDICDRFIAPALRTAGWAEHQWRREYGFTDGKVIVRGNLIARGRRRRVDYLLFGPGNTPIAIVEAKDGSHSVGAGMQQALAYAVQLGVPFVFSSNGTGFLFHDRSGTSSQMEQLLELDEFPSEQTLWSRYLRWINVDDDKRQIVSSTGYSGSMAKELRYYQQLAVTRTIEAVARGERRLLLVMATGTGKTLTAFNIIWRLWKSGRAKRILYLADRNILIDQTIVNDFRPFGSAMTKLDRSLVDPATGRVDTSYEIYLALYQGVAGAENREPVYNKFPPDFFDLIVIDECHRGSAAEDSAWREILQYFQLAIQLGMTATPRETKYVSNIDYFGEPVYAYSLRQGIEDGFLAPYRVIRVDLDWDLQGWRPETDSVDDAGALIEDRIYNQSDFDRSIVFPERDAAVAHRLSVFQHETDPLAKTIVFCENIDHAERARQALVNEPLNRELVLQDRRYVMRITGDNEEGRAELDNFIDPKQRHPVIATTSRLLTTGVDAQTCQVIVLDRTIRSLTEFKQIIGRGTRLRPDYGKFYFTIIDFRKATELFADPEWDGPPTQVLEVDSDGRVVEVEDPRDALEDIETIIRSAGNDPDSAGEVEAGAKKFVVSGVPFTIIAERIQYYDKDGKLVTESLRSYTKRAVLNEFESLEGFRRRWNAAARKEVVLELLLERGVILEALADAVNRDLDPFDLICHVAFDQPALTRRERAEGVRKQDVFTQYGEAAREVLDALLDKYADHGISSIEEVEILKVRPLSELGTPVELVRRFGGRQRYSEALSGLECALYSVS